MTEKKKARAPFSFAGGEVAAGRRGDFALTVPDLYVHADLTIPVHVVHGRRDGPVLFLSGAIHGDEIIGVEIIRRVLSSRRLARLRGTLLATPVVNIFGFLNQSRYLPDRRDLNRCFPGSEGGSIASRLANTFMTEVVSRCSHGIDLHTAAVNRENLPQVRAATQDPEVEAMAHAFGLPVIVNSELIEGSLRFAAGEEGARVIVYEAGEALRFDETAIRGGVHGILRVMEHLGMLRGRVRPARSGTRHREPSVSRNTRWVRASQSGIHRSVVPMGGRVEKGALLGFIADPMGHNEAPVVAPIDGVVIGRSNLPLVTEGEALFHIASFRAETDRVAEEIGQVEEVLEAVVREVDEPPIV